MTFPGQLAARQAGAGPPLPAESVHQAPGRGQEAGPESPVAPGSFWPPAGPVRRAARRRGAGRGKASGTDGRGRAAPQDSGKEGAGRPWRESWAEEEEEAATSAAHPGKSGDLPAAFLLPPSAVPRPTESGAAGAAPAGTRRLTPPERRAPGTELELPAWSEREGRTACLRGEASAERPTRRPGSPGATRGR